MKTILRMICERVRDYYFYSWVNRKHKEDDDGLDILAKYTKWAAITWRFQ